MITLLVKRAITLLIHPNPFKIRGNWHNGVMETQLDFLEQSARRLLAGCRVPAHDGTFLYVPDGRSHYQALWTRDFAYMVENVGDLMPLEEVRACIETLLSGQRADGVIPDRVRPDGVAVYVAGPEDQPMGGWNLDNAAFLVIAADEHLKRLDPRQAAERFSPWAATLARGLDVIPLSPNGLVWNDPAAPHSPYGFTDTVRKTGELFFESLLYWDACRRIAARLPGEQAARFVSRAEKIESGLEILWDRNAGAFHAASHDCRQLDVWGCAFALWIDFPLGEQRQLVVDFLATNFERYTYKGQVRHLLEPETWQRTFIPIPAGEYQNGAFWATASGWVWHALRPVRPDLAERLLEELVTDLRTNGIYECVNGEYRKLESYVVSATNILGALKR
jgi:hypothetical protein